MRKFDKKTFALVTFILAISLTQLYFSGFIPKDQNSRKIDFYGGIEKAPLWLLDTDDAIERCERQKWNEECYDWFTNPKNLEEWDKDTISEIFNSYKSKSKYSCYNYGWLYRSLSGVGISKPLIDTAILRQDLVKLCLEKNCGIACGVLGAVNRYSESKVKVVEAILWYHLSNIYKKEDPSLIVATAELKRLRISPEAFILFADRANREHLKGYLKKNEINEVINRYYTSSGDHKD